MKRIGLFLLLLVSLCGGCGFSDKPETAVKHFLDAAKKFNLETMSEYVSMSGFQTPGSDPEFQDALTSFLSKANQKLYYAIEETTKTDDTHATVQIKVHYPDKTEQFAAISRAYQARGKGLDTLTALLAQPPGPDTTLFQETTLTIACVKHADTWKIESLDMDLLNVITCNLANMFISK